jgi:hypothetical protein
VKSKVRSANGAAADGGEIAQVVITYRLIEASGCTCRLPGAAPSAKQMGLE